jgi:chemotaxis-related protein WspD
VLGVANIRGELIVCVSLAEALGVGDAGAGARLAVLERGAERFAFPTAEVAGLHRYHPAELSPVPATLARAQSACIHGMVTYDGRTAGVIDDGRLFALLNRSLV